MASNKATIEPTVSTRVGATRLAQYGLYAATVAIAVNALVLVIALGVFTVPAEYEPLGWMPVIASSAVGVVGATVVYGLITRISKRPKRTFVVVAALVLLVSFVPLVSPPAELVGAPQSVLVTLGLMHVTTAAVAVGVLLRATKLGVDSP
ncbi:MAG: hypothetical protein IH933_04200 [Euryarchaeota archaeon]|nr:hypothetical protein [Euryarchaeota archaeon]